MDYQKQAEDFLKKANANIIITKAENQSAPLWAKDGENYGFKYNIVITRENKTPFKFDFWNSIKDREDSENAEKLIKGETITIKPYFGHPFEIKREFVRFIGRGDYPQNLNKFGNDLINDYEAGKFNPSHYAILACLTKYNPGSFEDFCTEYGYNEDSRTAEKTFLAVIKEWNETGRIFGDVMEELREIN